MKLRVALVHDWLLGMRGGERCLEVLCSFFPDADLFTAFYRPGRVSAEISLHDVVVSPLGSLPWSHRYYRYLLPFYPHAARTLSRSLIRKFEARRYDLVISVSHCLAKNLDMPQGVFHLCYCLTPMRYIWDKYDSYFNGHPLEPVVAQVAKRLRRWDRDYAARVDHFVAISRFVQKRIAGVYGAESDVVYPPVRTDWISARSNTDEGDGFLCVNALVPYKNVDLIVRAFNDLPYQLTVVGDGPLRKGLERLAGPNITFLQHVSDAELAYLYRRAKALVFAAEEDFGMVPVECQAAGRPVIGYGRGGILETVRAGVVRPTGVFFADLTIEALQAAVLDFVGRQHEFTVDNSLEQAAEFSPARFKREFLEVIKARGFPVLEEERKVAGL